MTLVAIAFHDQVAMDKLRAYYRSPQASARSATRSMGRNKCGLTFAVVLINRDDIRNTNHLDDLRKRIESDCIGGIHQDEYKLNVELIS